METGSHREKIPRDHFFVFATGHQPTTTNYFTSVLSPESHLRQQGLAPLAWEEILARVEQKLTPTESQTFQRLHRAFAAYPAAHTVRAFYDFAAQRDLLALLAGYRFDRLVDLAGALSLQGLAGKRVLDYGAGGGYLAAWLRAAGAEVTVADFSPATLRRLEGLGYPALADTAATSAARFDRIVCADSLGEVNADEDDWLSAPENLEDPAYPGELDARYGFAEKLAPLKPLLAGDGCVLLFEPVRHPHFWQGAARALEAAGWRAEVLSAPAWGLKLQAVGGRQ
jgi:SAM-dependent methyltransferase